MEHDYSSHIKYLSERYDIPAYKIRIIDNHVGGGNCIFMEGIFGGYADEAFDHEVEMYFLLKDGEDEYKHWRVTK